jgi:hypothetical protein
MARWLCFFPAAHITHECDSDADWYDPSLQASQLMLPFPASKRPLAHGEHCAAAAKLKRPAVQFMHRAAPDASSLCLPASHASHSGCACVVVILPPSHCWHAPAPAPLYLPTLQSAHVVLPGVGWCRPASHASQYVEPAADCFLPMAHCVHDVCAVSGW